MVPLLVAHGPSQIPSQQSAPSDSPLAVRSISPLPPPPPPPTPPGVWDACFCPFPSPSRHEVEAKEFHLSVLISSSDGQQVPCQIQPNRWVLVLLQICGIADDVNVSRHLVKCSPASPVFCCVDQQRWPAGTLSDAAQITPCSTCMVHNMAGCNFGEQVPC